MARRAAGLAAPGRIVAGIWEAHKNWREHVPVEAIIADELLGSVSERIHSAEDEYSFYGHVAIRFYGQDQLEPKRTLLSILVKRTGPAAYKRRPVSKALARDNRLISRLFTS